MAFWKKSVHVCVHVCIWAGMHVHTHPQTHTTCSYMFSKQTNKNTIFYTIYIFSKTDILEFFCAICINCTGQSVNERFKHKFHAFWKHKRARQQYVLQLCFLRMLLSHLAQVHSNGLFKHVAYCRHRVRVRVLGTGIAPLKALQGVQINALECCLTRPS